jgi:hypothetical protein
MSEIKGYWMEMTSRVSGWNAINWVPSKEHLRTSFNRYRFVSDESEVAERDGNKLARVRQETIKECAELVEGLGIQADPVVINKRTLTPSWWPKAERVLIIGYLTQLALVTYFWLALKGR